MKRVFTEETVKKCVIGDFETLPTYRLKNKVVKAVASMSGAVFHYPSKEIEMVIYSGNSMTICKIKELFFRCSGRNADNYEVEIGDARMHALVIIGNPAFMINFLKRMIDGGYTTKRFRIEAMEMIIQGMYDLLGSNEFSLRRKLSETNLFVIDD